jgi:hypothetical protein
LSEHFFTSETLPELGLRDYRKVRFTRAVRIQGTFHCLTSEGNVASCTDGWLAIDSRGFPYPINAIEFGTTYEPVEASNLEEEEAAGTL